jgi:transposase
MEKTVEKRTRVKRKFTDEFKVEAVSLGKRIGSSKAGKELGISESLIRAWNRKHGHGLDRGNKTYSELEKENRKLIKENSYLLEINSVLKKSTAIFSQDLMAKLK